MCRPSRRYFYLLAKTKSVKRHSEAKTNFVNYTYTRESVAERFAVFIRREGERSNQREMETLMRLAKLYLWCKLLRHESLQAAVLQAL